MPKDTERYRRLPKTRLKIEYRPSISGVVANLERWNAEPPAGSRAGRGSGGFAPETESFFVVGYPKLSFIGGSSAAGSPRVESLVETFALWRDPFPGSEKICREVVTK